MNKSIREMQLANKKKVFYLNKEEIEFLDNQMENYVKHGIVLTENSVVFDVGANIGMFCLYCCELCSRNPEIYAFEPIPQIFEVLQLNVQRLDSDRIKIYNYGISNQTRNEVIFEYFPGASGFSTMYSENLEEFRNSIKSVILHNIEALATFINEIRLIRILPSFLQTWVVDFELNRKLKSKKVVCQVKTISQIISEHNIQQIDLLKIDVEKSELDVLLGIKNQDWSKIKQIVIEVHDLGGRVDKIKALLSTHNFGKIIIEQETYLSNSEYLNIYAMR
ncbi:FkbM family methyltransferase [Myxosarcina sp. GI1]|uniref:FkbM family methyltransferase n=1 Tax=Myxosarcina sp. GI1 TaxID=1541065 RepID=UPI00055FD7D1|nr:FkbM family methyltransferase [Myxosarcina sp. GI1]